MTEQSVKQWHPLHESIVGAINRASYSDMRCLGTLISETKIPKGHDEISAAWSSRLGELIRETSELADVLNVLQEQKREAEEKEKAKEQKETVSS